MPLVVWHSKPDLLDRPSNLKGVLCLVESGALCLTMFLETVARGGFPSCWDYSMYADVLYRSL